MISFYILYVQEMLNKEQQKAVEAVLEGHNVFITGEPGTGKSFTMKHIIAKLKDLGRRFAITSSTGCSAVLIGGQTVHSYLGMGTGSKTIDKIVEGIKGKKLDDLQKLQILIIDEISMIDNHTLEKMSSIMQRIKKEYARAFGGVQVIFIGDFCQLPPVSGNYCFLSDVWKQLGFTCIILKELVRQQDDPEFQQILHEIRIGKCSHSTFQRLKALKDTKFEDGQKATRLYSLNSHVDLVNQHEFMKIFKRNRCTGNITECSPRLSMPTVEYNHIEASEKDIYKYKACSTDRNLNLEDYHITLMIGLQVIVIRNINFETGLVNGTSGIICGMDESSVCIVDNKKQKHIIEYHTDINENNNTHVKFMPLKLAYALSIHKSQGATLDAIEVDGSTFIFAPGQLYTAISRARSLNRIRLLNLDKDSFICNNNVKEFYENLSANSLE